MLEKYSFRLKKKKPTKLAPVTEALCAVAHAKKQGRGGNN